jgi:hypothetical protein
MEAGTALIKILPLMPYFLAVGIALVTGNTAYKVFSKADENQ